ncbi:hypothetical protein BDW74DRAFT_183787 [Aspergillus multicolor]|uniref:uncharacterized protein n=1 Tax=Aspergillus multicolor TaxID=41759 RepID=UPI003CCC912D
MAKWSKEEVAVLVYFASLGVQRHVITLLLKERGFHRTDSSITHKIEELERNWQLKCNKDWKQDKVNQLLDTLEVDLILLLQPLASDQAIINQVSQDIRESDLGLNDV